MINLLKPIQKSAFNIFAAQSTPLIYTDAPRPLGHVPHIPRQPGFLGANDRRRRG